MQLIIIDELGYVPSDEVAAELLVPGDRRVSRKIRRHGHRQSALLRVAPSLAYCTTLQGHA